MTRRARQALSDRRRPPVPARLAWTLWMLLAATVTPVCQAQGLWLLVLLVPLLAGLGIWLSQRRGKPILSQAVSASIAVVLAVTAALVSADTGLVGVYAVADWLIAVAILKCWQLGTSRDCAHVLIIAALLLLVGAMVSGQLTYATSLMVTLVMAPAALMHWHLLGETERLARVRSQPNGVGGTMHPGRPAGPMRRMTAAAAMFCAAAGFVIFATFPRLRTPLQPRVQTSAVAVTGFSTESRLNEIGRMQQSDRVYMRVRLSAGGQPSGSQNDQPYFRAMTYTRYNGYGWEEQGIGRIVDVSLPSDASLKYFRQVKTPDPQGAVEQEYWIEAGPPPRLFSLAMYVPVAVGSQEIASVQRNLSDDTLVPMGKLAATVHYKILSVPPYVLAEPPAAPELHDPPTGDPLGGNPRRVRPRPVVKPEVAALARALATEVTGDAEDPAKDPATHEQIVNRFMRHLGSGEFTYTLEGQPRAGGFGRLETFLFRSKRGYCEYFASALTVLCQCVGIPARYVTGFHGGQYNEVGSFYSVRDSDAHSWVEVWLAEAGWRTFDPTPAEADQYSSSLGGRLAGMLDYLQFQWSSWVVAYDILHRQTLFGTFGDWLQEPTFPKEQSWTRFLWTFEQLLMGPETLSPLGKTLYWLGLVGVLALSGYLAVQLARQSAQWLRQYRQGRLVREGGVRFYQRVVAALARQGLQRRTTETPREFARRIEESNPQMEGLLIELIERYYAARFGGTGPAEAGEQLSQQVLARLAGRSEGRTT